MNLNPIKLVEFTGTFKTAEGSTNILIEKEINTVNFNLHSGTWQCCVKNCSYACAPSQTKNAIFFDIISNLLVEQNPSEHKSKVDVILFRFLCNQNKSETFYGDTWFNITKPTLCPRLFIKCHNLIEPVKPSVNVTISVLVAFRRVL